MNVFTDFLERKKKTNERVCIYLNMPQKTYDRSGNVSKENYMMLSGKVIDVDANAVVLENQECLINTDYIISVKPDKNY